jgi:hypothetical protein
MNPGVVGNLAALAVPVFLFIVLSAQVLVAGGGRNNDAEILDRPEEGIEKVRRWMRGSAESCIDALGMSAENFERLCASLQELGLHVLTLFDAGQTRNDEGTVQPAPLAVQERH